MRSWETRGRGWHGCAREEAPSTGRGDPHPRGAGLRRRPAAGSAPAATRCWPPGVPAARPIAAGRPLDFLPETRGIREGDWRVAPAPADLVDRRVEITGPTEPKMAINALNSGAKVWLADLEDANTPHWRNVVGGQVVLHDAVRRHAGLHHARRARSTGCATTASCRRSCRGPRGWHCDERHLLVDGEPAVGALVDFGLYFFHNAAELLDARQRPVLLPAEDGEPPRGAALERRVRPRRAARSASRTARSAPRC